MILKLVLRNDYNQYDKSWLQYIELDLKVLVLLKQPVSPKMLTTLKA